MSENEMDTVLKRALHYVECYDLHFPDSGAADVVKELTQEILDANRYIVNHEVELTKYQRARLEILWRYFGNGGPHHSIAGHKFIQGFLEHGCDYRDFYKPDELVVEYVDLALKGIQTEDLLTTFSGKILTAMDEHMEKKNKNNPYYKMIRFHIRSAALVLKLEDRFLEE